MGGDFHVDQAAVFQAVAPLPGKCQAACAIDRIFQPCDIFGRTDVRQSHAQELIVGIAVMGYGRMIDFEEAQRIPVEHPHRQRVVLKQQPELRVPLL